MYQKEVINQYSNGLQKELIKLFHNSGLPNHFNKTGYKDFTNYQRISLIVLFKKSNNSIRDFLKEIKETKWPSWLGLKRIPGRSTLHDWIRLFGTSLIRDLINLVTDVSNLKVAAIDGSGIESSHKSPYYKKRLKDFKQKTKDGYHKLDIIVNTYGKKQIIEYSFLLKNRNDSFVGKRLLKKFKIKRCKIVADKGYPDYLFEEIAKKMLNNFISPPKDYKGKCRQNNLKRRRKEENYKANKKAYKRRSIVESVFSLLKRVQGLRLRSRLHYMKKREMAWNILYYNLRMNIKSYVLKPNYNQLKFNYFL